MPFRESFQGFAVGGVPVETVRRSNPKIPKEFNHQVLQSLWFSNSRSLEVDEWHCCSGTLVQMGKQWRHTYTGKIMSPKIENGKQWTLLGMFLWAFSRPLHYSPTKHPINWSPRPCPRPLKHHTWCTTPKQTHTLPTSAWATVHVHERTFVQLLLRDIQSLHWFRERLSVFLLQTIGEQPPHNCFESWITTHLRKSSQKIRVRTAFTKSSMQSQKKRIRTDTSIPVQRPHGYT